MIRVLYAGSPEASAKCLARLLEKSGAGVHGTDGSAGGVGYEIAGVLTNPPSARGRKKELLPTEVARFAESKGIEVFAPKSLDAEFRNVVLERGFDVLVCFAYGRIFGPKFLALFKAGGMNLHPSALPKYRGATPIPAAILNMDKSTAVTVQTLALGMDEGEILARQKIELDFTETTDFLLEESARIGADLMDALLRKCAEGGRLPEGVPQSGKASYTRTISRDDALINWSEPARKVDAHIRAYTSEPGAFTRINSSDGETLKILKAGVWFGENGVAGVPVREGVAAQAGGANDGSGASVGQSALCGTVIGIDKKKGILVQCGQGILCVTELQRQQRKAMNFKDFINGYGRTQNKESDFIGAVLC